MGVVTARPLCTRARMKRHGWVRSKPVIKLCGVYKLEGSTAIKTVTTKRVPVFREDIRVVKFKMKEIVPARTSARLQEGMTGHAPCKKFELSRVVFDEILRGLPTDINIPLRGQPKWPFGRYV